MSIQLASSPRWTCPHCRVSVNVPAWSRRIACACGHVYVREPAGIRLERIDTTVKRPVRGPGAELHVALGRCKPFEHCAQMDEWGPDGCEEHFDEIVGWIVEEGSARGDPMSRDAAERLLRRVIERAKSANRPQPAESSSGNSSA